ASLDQQCRARDRNARVRHSDRNGQAEEPARRTASDHRDDHRTAVRDGGRCLSRAARAGAQPDRRLAAAPGHAAAGAAGDRACRDTATLPRVPVVISWRCVGIFLRDNSPFALILFGPPGATKLEYRTIGEALPDGSTLVQIDTDSVTAQNGPGLPAGSVVRRL